MSKFNERARDLFYDTTDFVIILIIIASVSGIVWWRLNIMFNSELTISKNDTNISENASETSKSNASNDLIEEEKNKQKGIITVEIPPESLPDTIANILLENNVITDKFEFLKKSQEMELDTKMKPGKYEFLKGESVEDVIRKVTK